MSVKRDSVVVLGADINGLAAAITLARGGRKILVLDGAQIAGATSAAAEFAAGYRHQGVLHDHGGTRSRLLDTVAPGLPLQRRTDAPFIPQPAADGPGLLLDPTQAPDALADAGLSNELESWQAFERFTAHLKPWISGLVDRPPPALLEPRARDLLHLARHGLGLRRLGRRSMADVLRVLPMSAGDWLREWFDAPLLLAGLAAPALYDSGLGPGAPGTNANLILSLCAREAPVLGGASAIAAALAERAREGGVEFALGDAPKRLIVESGRAIAVETVSGQTHEASCFAAACDPRHLFLDLIGGRNLERRFVRHLKAYRCRGTTAKVHLALDGLPALACRPGHAPAWLRIGASLRDLERSSDAWKYGDVAVTPALDVRIPTLDDPSLAPQGHHVLSATVHTVGTRCAPEFRDRQREQVLEATLDTLSLYLPDLRQNVVASEVLTPQDLEERFGITGGHLLHGEQGLDQLIVRPTPECAGYSTPIEGLFLCGGGSHPGGALPGSSGVLAAAVIAARI